MHEVCVGIAAAPLRSTYDVKVVRGRCCFVPDFMSLCSWELPSAAHLQSCYYRGHSVGHSDSPCGCCEGRWSVSQCIRVKNLEFCALCQASLEAYRVVWLSALCLGQSCILAPVKCARLLAREACSRDSAWEYRAKVYWGPDLAQSF